MRILRWFDRQAAAGNAPLRPGDDDGGHGVAASARPALGVLVVAVQLALLVLVIAEFRLENAGFRRLAAVLSGAFVIHAFLPLAQRIRFLLLVSLGGMVFVIGVAGAAWVVAVGLVLAGICHLPLSFRLRLLALVAAGGVLGWLLWTDLAPPTLAAVWPVVGAMFMFRSFLYLYDLARTEAPASPAWTFSYFFLLPNVSLPLFPVVDYERFRSSYFAREPLRIYQRGVRWMLRGVVQLLFYRLVHNLFFIDASEVEGALDLIRHLTTSLLLFTQISGRFHIVVGILLLFGFDLPRPHRMYLLASSLPDFWRRINVYWKDFIAKIFFYPVYFKLRTGGRSTAVAAAITVAFLATWLLHSYQWFWLAGTLLVARSDVLFWALSALLVVLTVALGERPGGVGERGWRQRSASLRLALVLRTLATFSVVCVLWSLWRSGSLAEWLALWLPAGDFWQLVIAWVVALELAALALERWAQRGGGALEARAAAAPRRGGIGMTPMAATVVTTMAIALLAASGMRPLQARLGAGIKRTLRALGDARTNQQNAARLERGYYRDLLSLNEYNSGLWSLHKHHPWEFRTIQQTAAWQVTDNVMLGQFRPDSRISFKEQEFTVNSWGMRDQPYTLEKAPGVCRVAFLGSSHVLGSGVADSEPFEALLEEELNAASRTAGEQSEQVRCERYEVLNFAGAGRNPIQFLYRLEHQVLRFDPDIVIIVGHHQDKEILDKYLPRLIQSEVEIPYEFLRRILRRERLDAGSDAAVIKRRLKPYAGEILEATYREFVAVTRAHGLEPYWLLLPMVYDPQMDGNPVFVRRMGQMEGIGFSVLSLADVYRGHTSEELRLTPWDSHPNVFAHQLIADQMRGLLQHPLDILEER